MSILKILNNYFNPFSETAKKEFGALKGSQKVAAVAAAFFASLIPLGFPTILAFRAVVIRFSEKNKAQQTQATKDQTSQTQPPADQTSQTQPPADQTPQTQATNKPNQVLAADQTPQTQSSDQARQTQAAAMVAKRIIESQNDQEADLHMRVFSENVQKLKESKVAKLNDIKKPLDEGFIEAIKFLKESFAVKTDVLIFREQISTPITIARRLNGSADDFKFLFGLAGDKKQFTRDEVIAFFDSLLALMPSQANAPEPVHEVVVPHGQSKPKFDPKPFIDAFTMALTSNGVALNAVNAMDSQEQKLKKLIELMNQHRVRHVEFKGLEVPHYPGNGIWSAMPYVTSIKLTAPAGELKLGTRFAQSYPSLRKLEVYTNRRTEVSIDEEFAKRLNITKSELARMKCGEKSLEDFEKNRQLEATRQLAVFYEGREDREELFTAFHSMQLSLYQALEFTRKHIADVAQTCRTSFAVPILKKIAHQFSLDGEVTLSGPNPVVRLQGSQNLNMYGQAYVSMSNYFDSHYSHHLPENDREELRRALRSGIDHVVTRPMTPQWREEIAERLEEVAERLEEVAESCLEDYKNGLPVVIPTGWQGHAINVVLDGDYLIITNKGDRYANADPIRVFQIDSSKMSKEIIMQIIKEDAEPPKIPKRANITIDEWRKEYLFFDKLPELLGAKNVINGPFATLEAKDQKAGNCSFANNKQALHALLFTRRLRANKGNIEDAKAWARKEYKTWSLHDRVQGVHEFLLLLDTMGEGHYSKATLMLMTDQIKDKLWKQIEAAKKLGIDTQIAENALKQLRVKFPD